MTAQNNKKFSLNQPIKTKPVSIDKEQKMNNLLVPPSSDSLLQVDCRINNPKNIIKFRAFLYSEAKRQSTHPVKIDEINQFIQSPDGQRGLALFISARPQSREIARPKHISECLNPITQKAHF